MNGIEKFEMENFVEGKGAPADLITEMYRQTGKDGVLTMPAWLYLYKNDMGQFDGSNISCRMNWTEQDARELSAEYRALCDSICEIGKELGKQPEDFRDYEKILSEEQLEVLEKYLYSADTSVEQKDLDDYFRARADFEDFDERLKEVEAHYLEDCRKDAEKRVGVSPYAYEVILFAQRLLMLARMGGT